MIALVATTDIHIVVEKLYTSQWIRIDGVGALVITPTRELAYQVNIYI